MSVSTEHASLMDRIYRLQSKFGFYDATRKFYLIGRDAMIDSLNVPAKGTVLEIGCGTGRNLVKVAQRYPTARLFGIDISREMLSASGKAIRNAGLENRCRLAFADAATFDPQKTFGRVSFDRVYISYSVSMIPQWEAVIEQALQLLAPGGELHIVDFGDLAERSSMSRKALYTWLRWYHVTPRANLFELCESLSAKQGHVVKQRRLYGGFTWIATIARADRALRPFVEAERDQMIAA